MKLWCSTCSCRPCLCDEHEGSMDCARNYPCEHCLPYDPQEEEKLVFAWHIHDDILVEPLAWGISIPVEYWVEKRGEKRGRLVRIVRDQDLVVFALGYNNAVKYLRFRKTNPPNDIDKKRAIKQYKTALKENYNASWMTELHKQECGCDLVPEDMLIAANDHGGMTDEYVMSKIEEVRNEAGKRKEKEPE